MNISTIEDRSKPAIEGGEPIRQTFLVFGRPAIEQADINEVVDTLRSGWIGTGPKVSRFEDMFRRYKGIEYVAAVSSCTAALHLSMLALKIGQGDEVITTPMTFCATVNAILHAGATPVFVDCEHDTMNIDPTQIERQITPKTRAILPVHFAGRPCEMNAILRIAQSHGLHVIEDCAHAIETEYHGRKAGTMGQTGCFSFYVTKNVVTAEGGMVISQDRAIDEQIKMLALHGLNIDAWKRFSDAGYKHYKVQMAGFKCNMTDLQASLGLHQLARVETNREKRKAIWQRYNQAFQDLPCWIPAAPAPGTVHAYHLYILLLDVDHLSVNRDFLLNAFVQENIGVGVHYLALHSHPFYQEAVRNGRDRFPNAEFISQRTLSLPLSPDMNDKDVDSVILAVRKLLTYYRKDS